MARGLCIAVLGLVLAAAAWGAESPEELLKQALLQEKSGDAAKAQRLYEQFLKEYPEHTQAVEIHFRLGKLLEGMGASEEAAGRLLAFVQQTEKKPHRSRPDALYLLGKLQGQAKNYDAALQNFEKLLNEGPGLYEEEVLNLSANYYTLRGRFEEAAAKLNLLRNRKDPRQAEEAAYRIAGVWLKAEKPDLAITALSDLANQFPQSTRVSELMLELAELFRRQKQEDKALSVCDQLRTRYKNSLEAQGAAYLLGLIYRDRKDYKKAVETLVGIVRERELEKRGLVAAALLTAGNLYFTELGDTAKAMELFEEAARSARNSEFEHKNQILEQCWFRLGEYHFQQKKFSVALEYFIFLRNLGTTLNVLNRILACQAELGTAEQGVFQTEEGLAMVRKKIEENPGSFMAAEGEVFLADYKSRETARKRGSLAKVIGEYGAILKKYGKEVLAQESLESYIHLQVGLCRAANPAKEEQLQAVAAFQRAGSIDPKSPYRILALENTALAYDRLGDAKNSWKTYQELYALSSDKTPVKGTEGKSLEYLKSMVTRADAPDLIQDSVKVLQNVIERNGRLSDQAREAHWYLAELYYMKKSFSQAAAEYKSFLQVYGPKQDAAGEVEQGPWKPKPIDERVLRIYEAAARVAHCWYMQGHEQNMVLAYRWIAKNFPEGNKYAAEAQYWLARELEKGAAGKTREGRRAVAEALWKNVVHPSLAFSDPNFPRQYLPWVGRAEQFKDVQKYVQQAMLRSAQVFSEIGEHETAANIFFQYMEKYPPLPKPPPPAGLPPGTVAPPDEDQEFFSDARYALAREYVILNNISNLITCCTPYLSGLRQDRFRIPALRMLGFHAGKAGRYPPAGEAYATLLDEYGPELKDPKGVPLPVPEKDRIRPNRYNWNGLRLPTPADLDLGEIRYQLGWLFWKQEQWEKAVQTLAPFLEDPALLKSKSRPGALYMAGQSAFKLYDHAGSNKFIRILIRDHPRFEALEEAYTYAARGLLEGKEWAEVERLCVEFAGRWPGSDHRSRMDLYKALAALGQGRSAEGLKLLASLADGALFEDVRAEAAYRLGRHHLEQSQPDPQQALPLLQKSVKLFPREESCLALARCCLKLNRLEEAVDHLERAIQEFPKGERKVLEEAGKLLPEARKALAASKQKP